MTLVFPDFPVDLWSGYESSLPERGSYGGPAALRVA